MTHGIDTQYDSGNRHGRLGHQDDREAHIHGLDPNGPVAAFIRDGGLALVRRRTHQSTLPSAEAAAPAYTDTYAAAAELAIAASEVELTATASLLDGPALLH